MKTANRHGIEWKKRGLSLLVLMGLAQAAWAAQDSFFVENFDVPAATTANHWVGSPLVLDTPGSDGVGSAYKATRTTAASGQTMIYAVLTSDQVAALQGRRVALSALVKAASLSAKPLSYNGVKVMLSYTTSDGHSAYPQASVGVGTFDWTKCGVRVALPSNLASVILYVGLESVSGTAWFDEIHLEADPIAFLENFDDGTSLAARWTGGTFASVSHGTGWAMQLSKTSASGVNEVVATLPDAQLAGRRVLLTGLVKGSGLSVPAGGSPGVKLMLQYQTSDLVTHTCPAHIAPSEGTPLPSPSAAFYVAPTGTFDWTHAYAVAVLPTDVVAGSLKLVLGLDSLSGAVAFDDVQIEENPSLYLETFEDPTELSANWTGTCFLTPHGTGHALTRTNSTVGSNSVVTAPLPFEALRGRRVVFRCLVKASGVSVPPQTWNGVKVLLVYQTSNGTHAYPQPPLPTGTYDWTPVSFVVNLPADTVSATIELGLEYSTGTACFDDLQLDAVDTVPVDWVNPTPNYKGHSVPVLRGTMVGPRSGFDAATLRSWGANLLRWPLGNAFANDGLSDPDFGTVLSEETGLLDAALPSISAQGMAVTLDLHTLSIHPFDGPEQQDLLIAAWKQLALKYKNTATVWAYDIVNEPNEGNAWTDDMLNWNQLAEQVALAIREVDPTKAIVIESAEGALAGAMDWLSPVRAGNIVYSIHSYAPITFTHQGVDGRPIGITYPGTIDGVTWNSAAQAETIAPAAAFQARYQTSIYVGEFSAVRWAPGALAYLTDATALFEGYGWDWSYHAYREWQGWSVEIGEDPAVATNSPTATQRLLLLESRFSSNVHPAP